METPIVFFLSLIGGLAAFGVIGYLLELIRDYQVKTPPPIAKPDPRTLEIEEHIARIHAMSDEWTAARGDTKPVTRRKPQRSKRKVKAKVKVAPKVAPKLVKPDSKTEAKIDAIPNGPIWRNKNRGPSRRLLAKPTILYFIKIKHRGGWVYKIGVTSQSVERRFKKEAVDIKVVWTRQYNSGAEAYKKESGILDYFNAYQFVGAVLANGGNSELFNRNVFA